MRIRAFSLFLAANVLLASDAFSGGRPAILDKAEAFEAAIERATFRFREEFLLIPTKDKELITGKAYLDKKNGRARVDYEGKVRAKVWLEKDLIYFYDAELNQLIIRRWDGFLTAHFQAFLDIPILWGFKDFEKRFDFAEVKASTPTYTELKATPKTAGGYHLTLVFDKTSGEPKALSLQMENYRAQVTLEDFDKKAKFRDKIFERNFPSGVAILDMTKNE